MKVAHFHTNTDWGGGEYQLQHLILNLQNLGVESLLFANREGALLSRAAESGIALPGLCTPSGFLDSRACTKAIAQKLASDGIQLLHAHDSKALTLALRIGRSRDLPVVLSRRIASPLRSNPLSKLKYSPHRIAAVIAISETVKNAMILSGFPSERIFVVQSGLDFSSLDTLQPSSQARSEYRNQYLAGGVGKLSSKKNWEMLLRVAAAVQEKGLDVGWLVVGDGPERDRLVAISETEGLKNTVHFVGFRNDAQQIIKAFDVMFFPSLIEGASVTVREAMYLGTPVVAVCAPGTMESLAGWGYGVHPHEIEEAAEMVVRLLTDTVTRQTMIEGAREHALLNYDIKSTALKTADVYHSVLQSRHRL